MVPNAAGLHFGGEYKETDQMFIPIYLASGYNTFHQTNHDILLFKVLPFPDNNDSSP